jgi:hypothetical protein
VSTSLRDGVYGDALCWSGYGDYSFEEMETRGWGFDANNNINTNSANQWDDIQRQTFTGNNVSFDMESGALPAEFTLWVLRLVSLPLEAPGLN